jgi:hypothetical protein
MSDAAALGDEPLPGLLEDLHTREVLPVTYGSVLNEAHFWACFFESLRRHEEEYTRIVEAHFDRHLSRFQYVMNPRDTEVVATAIGCFQDGSLPGKMQFGSAWWFNDQKDGIERQINTLSNMELRGGMVKDICFRNAAFYFGIEVE